jgi:hypothetical protein
VSNAWAGAWHKHRYNALQIRDHSCNSCLIHWLRSSVRCPSGTADDLGMPETTALRTARATAFRYYFGIRHSCFVIGSRFIRVIRDIGRLSPIRFNDSTIELFNASEAIRVHSCVFVVKIFFS